MNQLKLLGLFCIQIEAEYDIPEELLPRPVENPQRLIQALELDKMPELQEVIIPRHNNVLETKRWIERFVPKIKKVSITDYKRKSVFF